MDVDTGINESARKEVANGLARVLADTYTLYLKTHNYHWNVEGPRFFALHNMFEEQYRELWAAVDTIAERIRALGHKAPGTYQQFADLTSIPEENSLPGADEMIGNLVRGHEAVTRTARGVFKTAESADDEASMDLLTERMAAHEKTAWMLRSMLA